VARRSSWIHRIPNVLAELESSEAPLIDRSDLEALLDVSPRHALRLLHQLGAVEIGKNLVLERPRLIEGLRAIADGEDVRYERRRLARVSRVIEDLRQEVHARRVPIEVGTRPGDMLFGSLPAAVRLEPGRLEIRFTSPQELLARLYELSQAIANDYEQFEQALERGVPATGAPAP
jgi:hypothetical protein